MEQSELIQRLGSGEGFPDVNDGNVVVIQTHCSIVCLVGRYAYKFKKHIKFDFLDFRKLESRHEMCQTEVRLNRRMSSLYVGVSELYFNREFNTLHIVDKDDVHGKLHENSQPPAEFGELIDYAVKMIRFDNSKLMTQCLESGQVTEKCIDEIADILSDFYETVAITSPEISSYGNIDHIKRITQENLLFMQQLVESNSQHPLLSKTDVEEIQSATDTFFSHYAWLFEKRVREGRVKECHGDLHSGNICLSEPIEIFDCIEFNEEFKNLDIAFDIAFLCMDLDFYNERLLAERLVLSITEQTRDWDLVKLINFYKVIFITLCCQQTLTFSSNSQHSILYVIQCVRATTRGKVLSLLLNDGSVSQEKKDRAAERARKYFGLALEYARDVSRTKTTFKLALYVSHFLYSNESYN